ncbi:MAG: aminopeptidase, partial [Firmicutes bacterium]|nr:aminopeptidase [Bacillota bacterium]
MPNRETLQKYAEITVKMGLHLRKGQKVHIQTDIATAEFARMCALEAYKAGSTGVTFYWTDQASVKYAYQYADDHFIFDTPQFMVDRYAFLDGEDYAYLWIDSMDPNAFEGAPMDRVAKSIALRRKALRAHSRNTGGNRVTWSIVAIPSPAWAKTVFPDAANEDEAVEKLYDAIFKAVRLDTEDPVKAWEDHMATL